MAYKIGNVIIKDKEYANYETEQVTTNIHKEYLQDYRELMKSLNKPMSAGYSCLLELLLTDQDVVDKFINKLKQKY